MFWFLKIRLTKVISTLKIYDLTLYLLNNIYMKANVTKHKTGKSSKSVWFASSHKNHN